MIIVYKKSTSASLIIECCCQNLASSTCTHHGKNRQPISVAGDGAFIWTQSPQCFFSCFATFVCNLLTYLIIALNAMASVCYGKRLHCTHELRLLRRFEEASAADNDGNSAKHNTIKEINNIKWLLFRWQNWYKLSYKLFAWLPICCDFTVFNVNVYFGLIILVNRICSVYFSRKYDWLPWNCYTPSSRYFKYHYHVKTGLVQPFSSHVKWIDRIIIGITDAIIFIYSPIPPSHSASPSQSCFPLTSINQMNINFCQILPITSKHCDDDCSFFPFCFIFMTASTNCDRLSHI